MQVISGHLGWVRSVAFDPSNEWFCTGSADRTIKVISDVVMSSRLINVLLLLESFVFPYVLLSRLFMAMYMLPICDD